MKTLIKSPLSQRRLNSCLSSQISTTVTIDSDPFFHLHRDAWEKGREKKKKKYDDFFGSRLFRRKRARNFRIDQRSAQLLPRDFFRRVTTGFHRLVSGSCLDLTLLFVVSREITALIEHVRVWIKIGKSIDRIISTIMIEYWIG